MTIYLWAFARHILRQYSALLVILVAFVFVLCLLAVVAEPGPEIGPAHPQEIPGIYVEGQALCACPEESADE